MGNIKICSDHVNVIRNRGFVGMLGGPMVVDLGTRGCWEQNGAGVIAVTREASVYYRGYCQGGAGGQEWILPLPSGLPLCRHRSC